MLYSKKFAHGLNLFSFQPKSNCEICGDTFTGTFYAHKRLKHGLNRGGSRSKIKHCVDSISLPELTNAKEVCAYLATHVKTFYIDLQKHIINDGVPISIIPDEAALMDIDSLLIKTGNKTIHSITL